MLGFVTLNFSLVFVQDLIPRYVGLIALVVISLASLVLGRAVKLGRYMKLFFLMYFGFTFWILFSSLVNSSPAHDIATTGGLISVVSIVLMVPVYSGLVDARVLIRYGKMLGPIVALLVLFSIAGILFGAVADDPVYSRVLTLDVLGVKLKQCVSGAFTEPRYCSLTTNPARFAKLAMFSVPFLLLFSTHANAKRSSLIILGASVIVAFSLTLTRGAIAGATVAVIVYIGSTVLMHRKIRLIFASLINLALAGIILFGFYFSLSAANKGSRLFDTGLTGRGEAWIALWDFGLEHPLLGGGIGSVPSILSDKLGIDLTHAHNGFLSTFAEFGGPGLFLYCALLLFSIYIAILLLVRRSWYGPFMASFTMMIFTHQFVETTIFSYDFTHLVWIVVIVTGIRYLDGAQLMGSNMDEVAIGLVNRARSKTDDPCGRALQGDSSGLSVSLILALGQRRGS